MNIYNLFFFFFRLLLWFFILSFFLAFFTLDDIISLLNIYLLRFWILVVADIWKSSLGSRLRWGLGLVDLRWLVFFLLLLLISLLQFFFLQFFLLILLFIFGILSSLQILQILHTQRFNLIIFQLLNKLELLIVLQFNHDIFRLQVSMDDIATFVQINQTKQYISSDLLYKPKRHPLLFVFIVLNEVQQIRAHQLKHTTHMFTMDSVMNEVINQQQWSTKFWIYFLGILCLLSGYKFKPFFISLVIPELSEHLKLIDSWLSVRLLASLYF